MKSKPPCRMITWDCTPDVIAAIRSADLPGQIDALRKSGIVGGLNVERLGETKTIITTHGTTGEERRAWLRGLLKRPTMQSLGGKARARSMTRLEMSEAARKAALKRWRKRS